MSEDKRAGMQRVRVGLTGLGAVLLIVAISAAIFESARNKPAGNEVALNKSEQTVANMVVNATATPADPLTEIGVTPPAPAAANADAAVQAPSAAEPAR